MATSRLQTCLQQWKFFVSLLTPILLIPLPYFWEGKTGREPYAAYVTLLMAVYWMTECVPLAVTSLLPVTLMPLFGILSSDRVCSMYLEDSILFLMGGVVIALAVEYSNLHSRIAIKVILTIGAKIPRLLFGIMFTTMFLSMWMNNTSTTAMMVPIVLAIVEELKLKMLEYARSDRKLLQTECIEETPEGAEDQESENIEMAINDKITNLRIMFLIATAYASNIGGTGVITGSATNIVALDLIRKDAEHEQCPAACKQLLQIGFVDWMMFNIPPMLITTLLSWVFLQFHFLGVPPSWKFWQSQKNKQVYKEIAKMEAKVEANVTESLRKKYQQLGPISFHEVGVAVVFSVTVILWIMKNPQFMPGWEELPILKQKTPSGKSFIKESSPTFLMCMLLFIFPKESHYYKEISTGGLGRGMQDALLTWRFVRSKFPWGVFLLIGGGGALAVGARESGLNKLLEESLKASTTLQSISSPVLLIIMLCVLSVMTSLASNIACASILIPVLLALSYVKNFHPLYMVVAASTICSYAFMLPVSTPPNAIAYGASSDLKLSHMVKAGFGVTIIGLAVLYATTHLVGGLIFDFDTYNNECGNMTLIS